MDSFKKINLLKCCFIAFLFVIFLPPSCFARTNWSWIYSDKYQSTFIDKASLTSDASSSKVTSARLFVKITYNTDGGNMILNKIHKQYASPDKLYSMLDFTCNFADDTVSCSGIVYKESGTPLGNLPDEKPQKAYNSIFGDVYYYVSDSITGSKSFSIYKSPVFKLFKTHDENGKLYKVYANELSIHESNSLIYAKIVRTGFSPDNSIHDIILDETCFDEKNHLMTVTPYANYLKGRGWRYPQNAEYSKTIYPSSTAEQILKHLKQYVSANSSWSHRHDDYGLRIGGY